MAPPFHRSCSRACYPLNHARSSDTTFPPLCPHPSFPLGNSSVLVRGLDQLCRAFVAATPRPSRTTSNFLRRRPWAMPRPRPSHLERGPRSFPRCPCAAPHAASRSFLAFHGPTSWPIPAPHGTTLRSTLATLVPVSAFSGVASWLLPGFLGLPLLGPLSAVHAPCPPSAGGTRSREAVQERAGLLCFRIKQPTPQSWTSVAFIK